jgi:osmoprotectant transport system ATP-binding protein
MAHDARPKTRPEHAALSGRWPSPGAKELSASAALIELDRVVKSFDGGRGFALQGVSLRIEAASFVCLIGGSGSGKTTTMKMINRLLEPDSGTVRFDGAGVDRVAAPALRRRIGYVFQGIGLFPHMTIAENIGVTPRLLGWPPAEIAARVAELLDLVDLPKSFAARFPDALSGGQRQRVAVARAIAARPRVMLMDEPFGALDPITRDALGSAYRGLHDALGLTSVMVTHDVQEAVLLAEHRGRGADGDAAAPGGTRARASRGRRPAGQPWMNGSPPRWRCSRIMRRRMCC